MAYRYLRYPEGKYKAVTLSYDDGSNFDRRLIEKLNTTTLKCTFNINSERMLAGKDLTAEEIRKEILDKGHEVAVHGAKHLANGVVMPIDGIRDVLTCRETLEDTFGCIIRGMAYPDSGITRFCNGSDYDTVRRYLTDLGIVYARTLGGDNDRFELPNDFLAWMPSAHHTNPDVLAYIDKFLQIDITKDYHTRHFPRLFYLWGHAHEFHFQNNWELLDDICERLSGREDIWYATNIQIYDYVKAYQALVWSAKGDRVYNPGRMPVWFAVELKVYCVQPGQIVVIA